MNRRVWRWGLVAVGLSLLAGCASQHSAARYEYMDARKQEISMLWGQIRTWRRDAGLRGVEPPRRAILEMRGKPVATAGQVCAAPIEPRTQVCRDTCSLADAICENATQICQVADDLDGDPWADDKCSSAKASCREARQACCGCFRDEADDAVPAGAGGLDGEGESDGSGDPDDPDDPGEDDMSEGGDSEPTRPGESGSRDGDVPAGTVPAGAEPGANDPDGRESTAGERGSAPTPSSWGRHRLRSLKR